MPELREQLERIAQQLGDDSVQVVLEKPRSAEHGDVATNIAMLLAKKLKVSPRSIAEQVIAKLDLESAGLASAEIAGPGFINFRVATAKLHSALLEILRANQTFGRGEPDRKLRYQVEFVSANPTGPLHVAHGRGAALGDAVANLLQWEGHDVQREFYVNDAGLQVQRLGESIDVRLRQLAGESAEIPEGGYHGEYVTQLAQDLLDGGLGTDELKGPPEGRIAFLREWASNRLRTEQDRDLREFRVIMDEFFNESSLYREGRIEETLRELKERGLTYESEGATWLRTTDFGDDKDRVLVKSDGTFTYFLPDIAYHREKTRRGYDHVIDVWGADHHGYIPRMQAVLAALGHRNFLDVEIVQMVRIMRGGEEMKISKRSGEFVTLRELYEETGVDVARYFFLMRRSDAQMLFDLDLALDHSEKNPVFKVQYAHARMCSIFRKAVEQGAAAEASDEKMLALLTSDDEKNLIKQLSNFPDVVARAADARAPHVVCEYLETTAGLVNSWYHSGNPSRNPELAVLVPDEGLRQARLALARAVQIVLRNGLEVLGLRAPDRMDREETAA